MLKFRLSGSTLKILKNLIVPFEVSSSHEQCRASEISKKEILEISPLKGLIKVAVFSN